MKEINKEVTLEEQLVKDKFEVIRNKVNEIVQHINVEQKLKGLTYCQKHFCWYPKEGDCFSCGDKNGT